MHESLRMSKIVDKRKALESQIQSWQEVIDGRHVIFDDNLSQEEVMEIRRAQAENAKRYLEMDMKQLEELLE